MRVVLLIAAVSCLVVPTAVRAQQTDAANETDENSEAAEELVERARTATADGDYETAESLLLRAFGREPTAATAFNLALVERSLGKPLSARERMSRLLAGDYGELPAERRQRAEELYAELGAEIGTVFVTVSGVPQAGVRVDDRDVGAAGTGAVLRVPVDPGDHRVVVVAPGRTPVEREVTVGAGAVESVRVELAPSAEPVEPAPVLTVPEGEPAREGGGSALSSPWLWLGVGLAVAAGVVAAVVLWPGADEELPDGYLGTAAALGVHF